MTALEGARRSAVGHIPGRKRVAVLVVGLAFWGWLLARWAYHNTVLDRIATTLGFPDLLRSDIGVRSREPWLPAAPFESAAATIGDVGASLGSAGTPIGWIAWLFELVAFAIDSGPALASGAYITVYLTLISMFFGLFIAVPAAVARVYGGPITSRLSLIYTELIRGTPLLAQLFFLYFGLPLAGFFDGFDIVGQSGFPRAAILVAIVGFTINSSAYQAEYIRAALQSVDPGQLTAARSVGLSRLQGIRYVVLPQGLRFAIPGWTNEFVYLIKYSSLAAFITVPELFRQARNIGSSTFQFTDIYIIAAAFYLALVLTIAMAMNRFEQAIAIPGLGTAAESDR